MIWKEGLIRSVVFREEAEVILKIKLPSNPQPDFIAWHYEKLGMLKVRSAYRLALELREIEQGLNVLTH